MIMPKTNFSKTMLLSAITILLLFSLTLMADSEESPGFFRYPTTNGEWVVFTSEGDLWRVPFQGGTAFRLTTHEGEERFAHISEDIEGKKVIAFSGQDDGQDDVYIMSLEGGAPKRLTYHPGGDQVIGWTNDKNIIFRSRRDIPFRGSRIYTISPEGGFPEVIPLTKATLISHEPGGSRIAFNRYSREFRKWKRYKGGWAQDIWVGDLKTDTFKNITDNKGTNDWDGTDAFPMWDNNGRIYYLSDRSTRANIWSMLPDGSDPQQHTTHEDFDIRFPSKNGTLIVYQHKMDIWFYNVKTKQNKKIEITLPTDRVQAREKYSDPSKYISDFSLSHYGNRLMICSRGEIFTFPSKKEGLIRQLTFDSGIREKFPRWSDEGKEILFWADESNQEKLYSIPAEGGERKLIGTDGMGWHFPPNASPDGKFAAFSNEEQSLMLMNIKSGDLTEVDKGFWEIREYSWSPDSKYLVYSRYEENYNSTIWIWDIKKEKLHPVTDDYYNSYSPTFEPTGKYLYFLSDRIANPHLDGQEMTYILDKKTLPYMVTLTKEEINPFAPKADPKGDDDEFGGWKGGEKSKKGKKDDDKDDDEEEKEIKVEIDFDGLNDRIIALPVKPGNFYGLTAVKNKVFYMSRENKGMLGRAIYNDGPKGATLHKFNIKKKKHKIVDRGIRGYDISGNNKKIVIFKKGEFIVQGVDEGGFGGFGGFGKEDKDDDENSKNVDLSKWDLKVDVRSEWRQMFQESWRFQRDFFWTPDMHKVNWQAVYDKYFPLTERISTRSELTDLIGEMFGELNCSHTYVWGGDQRRTKYHSTGLLGVDLKKDESGYYQIERIIEGRPWDKKLTSPLADPGLDVNLDDYIIKVNGRSVAEVKNIYQLFMNKADNIISLTVNDKPDLKGSHEIIVKPMGNESRLRYWDWVDGRKEYTYKKSDGKIAYIHLANMGGMGLSQFTEAYQPQHRKPAMILDVRYNGGGFVAEMILAHLGRKLVSIGRPRHGSTYRSPQTAFRGHMAAVSNGETGSDGETFTEGFQRLGLGPVIGTRTWGGWVGIRSDKPLVDRGGITQPEFTGWGMDGTYLIEGWGSDPDQLVYEHPTAELNGTDPQLDATIEYLIKKMESEPVILPEAPEYPDRSKFAR